MAYKNLATSSLVFMSVRSGQTKVKASAYLSRHTQNVKLEKEYTATEGLVLSYSLSDDEEENGCSPRQSCEERFPKDSAVVLKIFYFNLFITGNFSYFADAPDIPDSSSYWCPLCLLSRLEWQQSARTIKFFEANEHCHQK